MLLIAICKRRKNLLKGRKPLRAVRTLALSGAKWTALFLLFAGLQASAKDRPLKKKYEPTTIDRAQPPAIEIRGVVKDEEGNPVEGVSITVVSGNKGVQTNASGAFTIEVPNRKAVLEASMVGYASQTNFGRTLRQPYFCDGELAERSNAAVLKTVEGYTSGGSNPSLSAAE